MPKLVLCLSNKMTATVRSRSHGKLLALVGTSWERKQRKRCNQRAAGSAIVRVGGAGSEAGRQEGINHQSMRGKKKMISAEGAMSLAGAVGMAPSRFIHARCAQ